MVIHVIILISSIFRILPCASCCGRHFEGRFSDVTDFLFDFFKTRNIEKCSKSDVDELFVELLEMDKYESDVEGDYQDIKFIDWEKINSIPDIDVDVSELKRQIKFIENISYLYVFEFFLRLLSNNNDINFMLTVNGVGGPVLESAGYINLEVGDILCNNECSRVLNLDSISNKDVKDGLKSVFTCAPIYDQSTNRIYSNNKNTLKLFGGIFLEVENKIDQNKLLYFYSLCEYLAQLGNPLFAICDNSEFEVSAIYNSLLLLDSVFKNLPFFKKVGSDFIINYEKKKNGMFVKMDKNDIFDKISQLGAVCENKMVMLAEVIVLNNILYYVFKSASLKNKKVIANLAFSSYGGRVFEMFISLLKNNYSNLSKFVDNNRSVRVAKNSINTVFIHGLLGSNNIKNESKGVFTTNNKKIFKDIGNKVISSDRLKYFDCPSIFSNDYNSLIDYYNCKINDRKITQIISNFVKNNGNSLIKSFIRWDFDDMLTSFYESEYNDGVLSQDGLFVYNKDITKGKIENILNKNIVSPFSNIEYKVTDSGLNECSYNYKTKGNNGFFIIEDKKIRYIHVGGGSHIVSSEDIDNFSIYEKRGRFLCNLLKEIY